PLFTKRNRHGNRVLYMKFNYFMHITTGFMKTEIKRLTPLLWTPAISILLLMSCAEDEHTYDGSGSFEATEIVVSSEATGTIEIFDVVDAQKLSQGEVVGYIDTTLLHLQKG